MRNVIRKYALQQLYFALHTFLCFWFTANEHTIKDLIQIRKRNWKTRRVNLGAVSVHACLLLHYVWMAKIIFRILFGYMAMACPLSNIHFADFSTIRNWRCKSTNAVWIWLFGLFVFRRIYEWTVKVYAARQCIVLCCIRYSFKQCCAWNRWGDYSKTEIL